MEPEPEIKIPTPPEFLDEEALAEWRRISQELVELNVLSEMDRAALAIYCVLWSRWVDSENHLKTYGYIIKSARTGGLIYSPYYGVANTAITQLRGWMGEFGMTPGSRSKIIAQLKEYLDKPPRRPDDWEEGEIIDVISDEERAARGRRIATILQKIGAADALTDGST